MKKGRLMNDPLNEDSSFIDLVGADFKEKMTLGFDLNNEDILSESGSAQGLD